MSLFITFRNTHYVFMSIILKRRETFLFSVHAIKYIKRINMREWQSAGANPFFLSCVIVRQSVSHPVVLTAEDCTWTLSAEQTPDSNSEPVLEGTRYEVTPLARSIAVLPRKGLSSATTAIPRMEFSLS